MLAYFTRKRPSGSINKTCALPVQLQSQPTIGPDTLVSGGPASLPATLAPPSRLKGHAQAYIDRAKLTVAQQQLLETKPQLATILNSLRLDKGPFAHLGQQLEAMTLLIERGGMQC